MSNRWRQLGGKWGTRLHRNDDGAITLAALAALMILIMVTLTIWDAGQAARDKIDAQNAADTAAYSQASVRARSMNMLAFTNVAKREVVSLHSLYYGMFTGFAIWWATRCSEAASFADDARLDCDRNRPLMMREGSAGGEWDRFAGDRFGLQVPRYRAEAKVATQMFDVPVQPNAWSKQAFGHEVMAIDDYQRYLVEVAPWWAWTQALVRGTRNGAHAISTFPPPGPTNLADGWIQQALGGINNQADNIHDFEVSCGDRQSDKLLNRMRPDSVQENELNTSGGINAAMIADTDRMSHASCIPIEATSQMPIAETDIRQQSEKNRSPLTQPLLRAIDGNTELHRRLSEEDAHDLEPFTLGLIYAIEASPPGLSPTKTTIAAGGGCWWSTFLFTDVHMGQNNGDDNPECANSTVRFHSIPYALGADARPSSSNYEHSSEALMARSNITFSYRHTPERAMRLSGSTVRGSGSETGYRNLMEKSNYQIDDRNNPVYTTKGYWSMSRAEIVYPHLDQSRDLYEDDSARGLWLFRPGWTAKLRPMALPDEWSNLNYGLNATFHATDEYFQVAENMGITTNPDAPGSANDVAEDLRFMDHATRTLDSRMRGTVK